MNEELSHEDVKAFMNEPEPVAEEKAPPPMDLDDLAPMEQQEQIEQTGRLTTVQLADFAFSVATTALARLGKPCWFITSTPPDIVGWTNFIINSAANPNNYDVCREIYENEVMKAWAESIYWPPFSKITIQERMFYFTFRSTVVTLLGVWAGH